MPVYKKQEGSDTWHWCANCPQYPKGEEVTSRQSKPDYGKLCTTCETLEQTGNCRKDPVFAGLK